jgi:ATP-binding cassette subfamily B protein
MPYLLKMRTRVILATLFLIVAKLANVAVPVALKGFGLVVKSLHL